MPKKDMAKRLTVAVGAPKPKGLADHLSAMKKQGKFKKKMGY